MWEKHPADPTSMIFWLKNRMPKEWGDTHRVEHGFDRYSDPLGGVVTAEDRAEVEALINEVLGEPKILEFPDLLGEPTTLEFSDMTLEIPARLKGKKFPKIPKEDGGEDDPAPSELEK